MGSETGEYIVIPESETIEKGVPAAGVAFVAEYGQAVRAIVGAFARSNPLQRVSNSSSIPRRASQHSALLELMKPDASATDRN